MFLRPGASARFLGRLVASLLLCLAATVSAMSLEIQGNLVFASGPVVDDLARFRDALDQAGVDTVVFVNSPGGDLWTGLRVGRLITERGINTVIAGYCVSACSIMFMGARSARLYDIGRMPVRVSYHCKAVQTPRSQCTELKQHNALSLGIVTSASLTPLTLPAQMRPSEAILGRELVQPLADPAAFFQGIANAHCPAEPCRKLVLAHATAARFSGLATAIGETGVGIVSNQDFYTVALGSHTEALARLVVPAAKLLSPDPAAPLVFYCADRECWHAVNAALRARRLGYSRVGWYRGGLLSWKAANLPVAIPVLRAVANLVDAK